MADTAPIRNIQTQPAAVVIDSPLNRRTEHNIHVYSVKPRAEVNEHIAELENEWSKERAIEAAASVLAIVGLVLGAFVSPWFLLLPGLVSALLLLHAVTRFCPGLALLQGLRSRCEINTEKFAMKALRGYGDSASTDTDKTELAGRVIAATRAYSSKS